MELVLFGLGFTLIVFWAIRDVMKPASWSHTTYTHQHETICVSCKQRGPYR